MFGIPLSTRKITGQQQQQQQLPFPSNIDTRTEKIDKHIYNNYKHVETVEKEEIDDYDILGCTRYDSIEHIKEQYKKLASIYHPDKSGSSDYFNKIQNAYKKISSKHRNFSNFPDVRKDYKETNSKDSFYIHKNHNLNNNNFNEHFIKQKEKDIEMGFIDPYSIGYTNFNHKNDIDKISLSRSNISVVVNPKHDKHLTTELINYKPYNNNNNNTHQELGITIISDFSTTSNSGLGLYDLELCYGSNKEYWEDAIKRNEKLWSKYNNKDNILYKANKLKEERVSDIYKPKDHMSSWSV